MSPFQFYTPRDGFSVHYTPAIPVPAGSVIDVVQATQAVGGFANVSGTEAHIDINKDRPEYLAHQTPSANSPLPEYGPVPGYPYDPLTVLDAPATDKSVRYLFTDVAYLRTGSTEVMLGAVNFEFDPSTGTTTIAGNAKVGPSSTAPINVPAQTPGKVFLDAQRRWRAGE